MPRREAAGVCRWCGCAGDHCTLPDGDRCVLPHGDVCCTGPGCARAEFNAARRTRRDEVRAIRDLKVKLQGQLVAERRAKQNGKPKKKRSKA